MHVLIIRGVVSLENWLKKMLDDIIFALAHIMILCLKINLCHQQCVTNGSIHYSYFYWNGQLFSNWPIWRNKICNTLFEKLKKMKLLKKMATLYLYREILRNFSETSHSRVYFSCSIPLLWHIKSLQTSI